MLESGFLKNFFSLWNTIKVRYAWFICFCLYAHTMIAAPIDSCRVRVLYKYHIATQDREHKPVTDSILSILEVGGSITQYGDLTEYVFLNRENPEAIKGIVADMFGIGINAYTFICHPYLGDGAMKVREFVHPGFYIYQEPMPTDWVMEPGTTKMMGYKCKKARLTYGGREWIAWYAPDLPISSGPWKLCGLPGLVLKAEDTTGTHRFEAYSLLKGNGLTIEEVSDAGDKKTTRDKFIAHRNKIKLDERYMTKPYYNDDPGAQFLLRPKEFYEQHGNCIEINRVRYPISSMPIPGGRLGAYTFNYFQPLELK